MPSPFSHAPYKAIQLPGEDTYVEVLTSGESRVLGLLVKGASNGEIASTLDVGLDTVKFHLKNIYSKWAVSSRTQAALLAVRAGLVSV